jgi:hypothetical protein
MAQEKSLTITHGLQTPPGALTVDQIQHFGMVFFQSGMFPDIRSAAQAEVKIMAGAELQFSPIYSMTKIYIVKGRVMVGAEALGAMIKRSGRYDYRVIKLTDTECSLMFTDNGKDVYQSDFTMEDAKRADLVQPNSGWYKWPRAMLMSKALSQGARIVAPHIISGVYVPEDFGFSTNPETEEVEGIVEDKPIVKVEKPVNQPAPEVRHAMEAKVKEAEKPAEDPAQKEAFEKMESAAPKENPVKIDMDWLKGSLDRLKYKTTIFSYIPTVPELKGINTVSKDIDKVVAQMTPTQQEILVKKLLERAELTGVKLD